MFKHIHSKFHSCIIVEVYLTYFFQPVFVCPHITNVILYVFIVKAANIIGLNFMALKFVTFLIFKSKYLHYVISNWTSVNIVLIII